MAKLSLEVEKAVVMGLKSLKALGDALTCIGVVQASVVLDDGTLEALGNLIFDKANEVCQALEMSWKTRGVIHQGYANVGVGNQRLSPKKLMQPEDKSKAKHKDLYRGMGICLAMKNMKTKRNFRIGKRGKEQSTKRSKMD
jgi:hypothetical protein